jgi:topoisomerase-4 subunit A
MTSENILSNTQTVDLVPALSQRYLAYAMSTIMSRSLPDVRDGLKPVHRRLLYAMRQLQLYPTTSHKKSARVVGDVIGKYHPHGDSAIYEAMVRLAQDFAQRYPLVDGQGNFGNIDGDNPAAMRYTEVRLTEVAELMLKGINEDAVDFRQTYDNEGNEPVILPAAFPNLLANGSQGIAVGMATNIPPHNILEICDALVLLIKKPEITCADLLEIIAGPDFPTGGVVLESKENLVKIYEQGRGSVRVRAKWHEEKLKSGLWQAVIFEVPYQIQKSKLIEQIAQLIEEKKLPLLEAVRDESTTDVRIVLEPKNRNVDPIICMEQLFRYTDLEIRYAYNLNLLNADNVPGVMSLKDILQAYLNHRLQVLVRSSKYRLDEVEGRLHILDGLLKVYLNLDELIRIIREEEEPKNVMISRWNLSDMQAEAILNMRLRSLRKIEQLEIESEHQKLVDEQKTIQGLLKDHKLQLNAVHHEIDGLKKLFLKNKQLGQRRTEITNPIDFDHKIDMVDVQLPSEPVTVFYSQKGWIRSYKGHHDNVSEVKYKEGDGPYLTILANSNDQLLLFSNQGRVYSLSVQDLPGGRGFGEPLRLMIDLPQDQEIIATSVYNPLLQLLLISQRAKGFIVKATDIFAQTKNGKQVFNLKPDDNLKFVIPVGDADHQLHVALLNSYQKLLILPVAGIPIMVKGQGVILQKSLPNAEITQVQAIKSGQGLSCQIRSRLQQLTDYKRWLGKRGQVGGGVEKGFQLIQAQ